MKKKIISRIMLILLSVSMLTLKFNVQPVKASGTIYIRADGSIDPLTANIKSVDNIIYTFTDNNYDSIVVERNDIVVDGAGYTLQGMGSGHGISLSGRNNVTIKNMIIKEFSLGICLTDYSSNNMILRNNVTANSWYGVCLGVTSFNNTISGNNITNNDYGLYLDSSSNNTISANNITFSEQCGFYLESSSGNNIVGNSIEYCRYSWGSGLFLSSSSGNTLRDNRIDENDFNFVVSGIGLADFVNDVDASNTVESKPIYYWVSKKDMFVPSDAGYVVLVNCTHITVQNLDHVDGVLLAYSTDSTVDRNNLTSTPHSIRLYFSLRNTISGNDISGGDRYSLYSISLYSSSYNNISGNRLTTPLGDGLELYSSSHNNISGNDIEYCGEGGKYEGSGIYLISSSSNAVSGNNITNSGFGLILRHNTLNNSITGNEIENNREAGLALWDSSTNNSISGNIIVNNGDGISESRSGHNAISDNNITNNYNGISLYESSNSSIYHNNFIGNARQVYVFSWEGFVEPSINVWDDGYPSGGNYWSDHVTVDNYFGVDQDEPGSDGIVDEPYIIADDNRDNYPLAKPWSSLVVSATVDVAPDTLHLMSQAQWVTCYIELPEDYNVNDVYVPTILLNDTIPVDPEAPTEIGDYDRDSIPDLMVKFDRATVSYYILSKRFANGYVSLFITGSVNGTTFRGEDTIRVLMTGGGTRGNK